MANTKKYCIAVSEIKNRSIASSDAKGVSPGHLLNSFYVQSRIKPIVPENYFLFLKKFSDLYGQLFKLEDKICGFMNRHQSNIYFGGNDLVALRYAFLIPSLFEYPPKPSSGITRMSCLSWSLISSRSFARRFRTESSFLFLVSTAIISNIVYS